MNNALYRVRMNGLECMGERKFQELSGKFGRVLFIVFQQVSSFVLLYKGFY
jgi:hypothetical protein